MNIGNLQTIQELESENQLSRLGQSLISKTLLRFEKQNLIIPKQQYYEQIFSDTDDQSSRLYDSILEKQGQPHNNSLLLQDIVTEKNIFDTVTDLPSILRIMNNPNFMSVLSQDKSANDSFLNIIRELNCWNVERAAENGQIQQSVVNPDSSISFNNYKQTLEVMNYLQNQLSLEDSFSNSKKQLINGATSFDSQISSKNELSSQKSNPQQQHQNKVQFNQFSLQLQAIVPPQVLLTSPDAQQIKNQPEKRKQLNSFSLHLPSNQKVIQKQPINLMPETETTSKLIYVPNRFSNTAKISDNYLIRTINDLPEPMISLGSETTQWTSPESKQGNLNYSTFSSKLDFFKKQQAILKQAERNHQKKIPQYDPFEKQKRMETQIISQINYDTMVKEDLPVFCVNCEEYVHLDKINSHADGECKKNQQNRIKRKLINCTQNQLFVNENTKEEELQIINDKIASIEYQLMQRINQQKIEKNKESPLVVSIMESSILSARQLKANGLTLDEINQILKQIKSSKTQIAGIPTSSQLGNISLLILWDRLLILGQAKAMNTGFYQTNNPKSSQLNRGNIPGTIICSSFSNRNSVRESLRGIDFNRDRFSSGHSASSSSTVRSPKQFYLASNQRINTLKDLPNKLDSFQLINCFHSDKNVESVCSVPTTKTQNDFIHNNSMY